MNEPKSAEVQRAIHDLYLSPFAGRRSQAAHLLGHLSTTSAEIVEALAVAAATDKDPDLRGAALFAMQAPVHQAFLAENPDFLQKVTQSAMQDKAEKQQAEDQRFMDEFARRRRNERRNYLIFFGLLILLCVVFIVNMVNMPRLSSTQGEECIFQFNALALAAVFMYLSWRNWRCPACHAWLGGFKAAINVFFASSPLRCPHCGTKLM